ncbi:MAG: hypothetical protein ABSG37_14540 [Candidatus Limnocylindrales bacterium]|jgi:hypothetical protein
MPEVGRLDRLVWAPVGAAWLWAAGVGIGLITGIATLEVNPLLAIPLALIWVYVAVRKPRVIGIAGALVGHGVAWIYLLATSGYGCASACWWTLPYGPSHTEDLGVWRTQTWEWIGCSVILLILGIALTVQLARRVRSQR